MTSVAREVLVADAANLPPIPDSDAEEGAGKPMKTARERAEEKRQEKLALVRDQVENGGLIIRQMTNEERRRYPPREARPKQQEKK